MNLLYAAVFEGWDACQNSMAESHSVHFAPVMRMHSKKPIDISLPEDDGSSRSRLYQAATLLACIGIVVFVSLAAFRFFSQPASPPQAGGEISLIVESQNLVEGQPAVVKAYSTCGNFTLSADGQEICAGTSGQVFSLPLAAGNHSVTAAGGNCSVSVPVQVASGSKKECNDGQTQACKLNGCSGTRTCFGGIWDVCQLPYRKCMPGARIGCALNSCSFGYSTCDKCGAGWGPCLPAGQASPLTGNSISCTGS